MGLGHFGSFALGIAIVVLTAIVAMYLGVVAVIGMSELKIAAFCGSYLVMAIFLTYLLVRFNPTAS